MQSRHQYHSTCILFSFVPSLAVFLHFSNHYSVWKCTSSCYCFLLSCSLSIHSRYEPHLLLGALCFVLGSARVACSLAYWMEDWPSPWFYFSFCDHHVQQLEGLWTRIKHHTILNHGTLTQPYSIFPNTDRLLDVVHTAYQATLAPLFQHCRPIAS